MKTTKRTILPDNTHERPVYELKLSKRVRYGLYYVAVAVPIGLGLAYSSIFERIGQFPSDLIICLVVSLLSYIVVVAVMGLLVGDIYFYERYVEMRRFLPFMKRKAIYYEEMHVHIKLGSFVTLNHYGTQPKFWESPNAWFKAYFSENINLPLTYTPEILEFLKTKALSVNNIKTPMRTTLPDNTHEQPVYEVKHSHTLQSKLFIKYGFYFLATILLLVNVFMWKTDAFTKLIGGAGGLGMAIRLVMMALFSLLSIFVLAIMATPGDIYFYERYVEIRRILPFMKRYVIYYDKMHVHIVEGTSFVILNHYETLPKFWKSPYTWLKAIYFANIGLANTRFTLFYDPKILEFVKTKAQSVTYYTDYIGKN